MSLPTPTELRQGLQGSWTLPVTDDASAVITFLGMGEFWWVVCANSLVEKAKQFVTGNQWHGDWSVVTERRANTVGEVARKSTRRKLKKIGWGGPAPAPGGAGSAAAGDVERGLFLRLNYMELPKSILNIPLPSLFAKGSGGMQIPVGNLSARIFQLFHTNDYRVLDFSPARLALRPCDGSRNQVWRRSGILHGGE